MNLSSKRKGNGTLWVVSTHKLENWNILGNRNYLSSKREGIGALWGVRTYKLGIWNTTGILNFGVSEHTSREFGTHWVL